MLDAPDQGESQLALNPVVTAVIELAGFRPAVGQLAEIRGYLMEIRSAIQELPEVAAVDDQLDVRFDPSWPEAEA